MAASVVCGATDWREAAALCTPSFTALSHGSSIAGISTTTSLLLRAATLDKLDKLRGPIAPAEAKLDTRFHVALCDSPARDRLLLDAEGRVSSLQ
jgi:hypothetical protein